MSKRGLAALLGAALLAGCGDGGTGPGQQRVTMTVVDGDGQFGTANAFLQAPLRLRVNDASTAKPVAGVTVRWRVLEGSSAVVNPATSASDSFGIAITNVRLGADTGVVRIEARATNLSGQAPVFQARTVLVPDLIAVSPSIAAAGQTVTVTGHNFSTTPEDNSVVFGGFRGQVLAATESELQVVVPACVPSRALMLTVSLGPVSSTAIPLQTIAGPGTVLNLERGEVRALTNAADLECIRLPGGTAGASYLFIPQNAASISNTVLPLEFRGVSTTGGTVTTVSPPPTPAGSSAAEAVSRWELQLRLRERQFRGSGPLGPAQQEEAVAAPPEIGDRRDFNVLNKDNQFTRITAEVKAISSHAIIYEDIEAPANGFTAADLDHFGQLFDDPIYATDVRVFGAPSDIDGNGKIIILFTPQVNALTSRQDNVFIVGYFYGCDLVEASKCSGTNRAEIFYSMVPDPSGLYSGVRTKQTVLNNVPPVLAHEFQHMINFAAKDGALDDLWLSEGLAHTAEDVVGSEFLARGDTADAKTFQTPNYKRAVLYLGDPSQTSMIDDQSPGSLEMRGAAWLFLKYLRGHYGGDALLGSLTRSKATGAANITGATGQPWSQLLSDFAVAIWADDAPELVGSSLDQRYTFPNLNVRQVLGQFQGGFPLHPSSLPYSDFELSETLPAASPAFFYLQAQTTSPQLNMNMTGVRSGPFAAGAAPQLSILRYH